MKPATFSLQLGPAGFEAVDVNGQDVTELLTGVSVLSQDGQPPLVRLALKGGIEVDRIAGEGVVEVEPAAGGTADPGRWLAAIDAAELEREVLDRSRFSTMSQGGSPIRVALEVLREWAER